MAPQTTNLATNVGKIKEETTVTPLSKGDESDDLNFKDLMLPLSFCILMVKFYINTYNDFKNDLDSNPQHDTFKDVWWSGPIFFTIAYLTMVFGGIRAMKDRKPAKVKTYMLIYNTYQVVLNLACVIGMLYEVYSNPWFKTMWGNYPQYGRESLNISFWVWVHYNNKYVELLDTTFMIIRKKNEQVSFLHCYHHVLLIWSWFLVCKIDAGGDSYFGGMVNSFIHVIMYAYYAMPIINVTVPKAIKMSVTHCQKIQFCVCLVHSCYVLYHGNCPPVLPLTQAFVMICMLILFTQFSNKRYGTNKKVSGVSTDMKKTE